MSKVIDLRSDTVTLPTPAMRKAMAEAELGDDVFGEDPTVNRLEAIAAEMMGKEAAVLLTSGTMGNLVGVLSHCQRGDEAIVGDQAHVFMYEVASCAAVGGVQLRTVTNVAGRLDPVALEAAFRLPNIHFPRTALVCLENTHNRCGGAVLTPEYIADVARLAHERGAQVHLDGARIFNAAVYLGIPARELTRQVDSVTFCLSKGLAAPVGSLLCGSHEYIARARKLRKMLGGGMRQAGVIAAAGIVALEQMIERLAEDHENARLLAEGLANIAGLKLDPREFPTNIVIVEITDSRFDAPTFLARLQEEGVRATYFGGRRIRMVPHYGIARADIESALQAVRRVLA
ncbi:MAG: low-specificity L-threonine aldolase [Chloroflexota bacterium]